MLRRKLLSSLGLAAACAALSLLPVESANAQRRGPDRHPSGTWELLGSQTVNFLGTDRDVIRVGRKDGKFRAIKLRVQDNDIELLDLKIIYANGAPEDIRVRQKLGKNSETRTIDLKGNTRFIREIQLAYKSRPSFRGRATVQVYGLH
ncbi:MAG: hypothetical protein AB7L90_04860 [Hyphomicrobiaceae bacterium]